MMTTMKMMTNLDYSMISNMKATLVSKLTIISQDILQMPVHKILHPVTNLLELMVNSLLVGMMVMENSLQVTLVVNELLM